MSPRSPTPARDDDPSRPPLFTLEEWRAIVRMLALSPRQAQIVGYLMQSKSRNEIQRALAITPSTFRTQYDRARARLSADDTMALAYRVFETFRTLAE